MNGYISGALGGCSSWVGSFERPRPALRSRGGSGKIEQGGPEIGAGKAAHLTGRSSPTRGPSGTGVGPLDRAPRDPQPPRIWDLKKKFFSRDISRNFLRSLSPLLGRYLKRVPVSPRPLDRVPGTANLPRRATRAPGALEVPDPLEVFGLGSREGARTLDGRNSGKVGPIDAKLGSE